ncbi:hypothetical protein [Piscinibacter gummiphilus]|uniref:Uncharacterized protein n=1 Tax=Piscinibacter gummiphilus TaxID=946333 RepID=A0ABZ0D4B6_9BURK|nr:hypothetical protein [Piscinibacter gummiphilus]WOB10077.1 hypothetical protein RXV79_08410 [Piscinibacter gummiphilus]
MHNIQKGRVDYLLDVWDAPARRCQPELVKPHLAREHIAPTVDQQADLCPTFPPEIVFIDSFSELTDQTFRHKVGGWTFCCNYLDLAHTEAFSDEFESLGPMDLSALDAAYDEMLKRIATRWPGVPVVYLHFPDALETREKFQQRARHIRDVVQSCEQRHDHLFAFSVPSTVVQRPEVLEPGLEDFPYHYNQATYDTFAEMIGNHPRLRRYF